MKNKTWDIDSFPNLFPSGQNGMFQDRPFPLKDQEFLCQRFNNKDTRFEQCPSYVFAAAAYLEEKQMDRNVGLSFTNRMLTNSEGNMRSYTLNDAYGVMDNVKNTPRYHKKKQDGDVGEAG